MKDKKGLFRMSRAAVIAAGFILLVKAIAMAEGAVEAAAPAVADGQRVVIAYAAMGAVGLSCMTSGYALAKIGSAALGAMSEKPELGGRALIFLGMAEGIAIYGLIIAIMLINKM